MSCGISWKWKTRKSGSRNNYAFVLSHASCPQNSRMHCGVEGTVQNISDLLLLVKTLYSCFLSFLEFLCGRDPWACFSLTLFLLKCVKRNLRELSHSRLREEAAAMWSAGLSPGARRARTLFPALKRELHSLRRSSVSGNPTRTRARVGDSLASSTWL